MRKTMTKTEKLAILTQYAQYFYGIDSIPENIQKILAYLENSEEFFNLEFCLFYKEGVLQPSFKFAVASSDFELIQELSILATGPEWVRPKKWKNLIHMQLIFDRRGLCTRVSFGLCKKDRIKNTIHDLMVNYHPWVESDWIESIRIYNHEFGVNYLTERATVWTFKEFQFIDIAFCKKLFFWEVQDTVYLLLSKEDSREYLPSDIKKLWIFPPSLFNQVGLYISFLCVTRTVFLGGDLDKISFYLCTS
jgi:hypothetical protein